MANLSVWFRYQWLPLDHILIQFEKLDIKGKGRIRWNHSGVSSLSVGVVRRTNQLSSLANRQLSHTLIPSSDDLSGPDLEFEGGSPIPGRIKLLSVF